MSYANQIAATLKVNPVHVQAAIDLLDKGNTLPFIARYRKEATGALDEDQLRRLMTMLDSLRALDERRQTIIASISEQGKLTPELHKQILEAQSRADLEDLYQPTNR